MTDFIGRKRVAYISYNGHSDFLETLRVYHGWQWSIYDGELGRIVARGEVSINALSARQAAEAEWRKYRNAPPKAGVKWRTLRSDMGKTVRMAKKKITPRQAAMQRSTAPKEDPRKLRMRAEELKLKAASLSNDADDLFAKAERIVQSVGRRLRPDKSDQISIQSFLIGTHLALLNMSTLIKIATRTEKEPAIRNTKESGLEDLRRRPKASNNSPVTDILTMPNSMIPRVPFGISLFCNFVEMLSVFVIDGSVVIGGQPAFRRV